MTAPADLDADAVLSAAARLRDCVDVRIAAENEVSVLRDQLFVLQEAVVAASNAEWAAQKDLARAINGLPIEIPSALMTTERPADESGEVAP